MRKWNCLALTTPPLCVFVLVHYPIPPRPRCPGRIKPRGGVFCDRLLVSVPLDLHYYKVVGDLVSESDVREVSSELDFVFALRQSLPQVHPESLARRIVGACGLPKRVIVRLYRPDEGSRCNACDLKVKT
jgi:hypothetical protein